MRRVGQNRIYSTKYTIYDRIVGHLPAKNTVCIYIHIWLWPILYMYNLVQRIFGHLPAIITRNRYMRMVLANPTDEQRLPS